VPCCVRRYRFAAPPELYGGGVQFFGRKEGSARKAYLQFLEEEPGIDREQELSGGGLVRSQGGWSKVQSMRRRGEKALGDERILGGDSFVKEVLKEAEERRDVLLPAHERLRLFDEDIGRACRDACLTPVFLRSGSKRGKLPSLRKELARKAVLEYGLSLAETVRQLGVTANAVSYMLNPQ